MPILRQFFHVNVLLDYRAKYFPKFTVVPMRKGSVATGTVREGLDFKTEVIEPFFWPGAFKEKVFDNPLVCDFEGLRGRAFSSGTLEACDPRITALLEDLEEIFRVHQVNGKVTVEQDTRVIYGQLPWG